MAAQSLSRSSNGSCTFSFLWPWNSVWLLITIFTWFYLQPSLARCAVLKPDWIAIMFVRNLALLWLINGGWHFLLYTLKLQGSERKYDPRWQSKDDPKFLFRNQVYDNIFWSCASGCTIWTIPSTQRYMGCSQ